MTQPLWTNEEIFAALGGKSSHDWQAFGLSIDSRNVAEGDLFIALKGENHDGHDFANKAKEAGAAALIVERELALDIPQILVEDSFKALYRLAEFARSRTKAKIIGVTGSVGKTGTKEMLKIALSSIAPTYASAGGLNNHIGLPLSLARIPQDAKFAVLEMGMNHKGELKELSLLARPHVALITTVESVHAEFFANEEEIAAAKAEIFIGMQANGVAILNRDNPHFFKLVEAALKHGLHRFISFGAHIDSYARLLDCAIDPTITHVLAMVNDHPIAYKIGVAGRQWAMNSLAVLAVVSVLGGDVAHASHALCHMEPPKGRGQRQIVRIEGGNFELIDESYNASPASMRAALAVLAASKPAKGARRIAVLGDMLELGHNSPHYHAALVKSIEMHGINLVFTAGPLMENLYNALPSQARGEWAINSKELLLLLEKSVKPGDVVMVKGSAGSKMGVIVDALKNKGVSNAL